MSLFCVNFSYAFVYHMQFNAFWHKIRRILYIFTLFISSIPDKFLPHRGSIPYTVHFLRVQLPFVLSRFFHRFIEPIPYATRLFIRLVHSDIRKRSVGKRSFFACFFAFSGYFGHFSLKKILFIVFYIRVGRELNPALFSPLFRSLKNIFSLPTRQKGFFISCPYTMEFPIVGVRIQ